MHVTIILTNHLTHILIFVCLCLRRSIINYKLDIVFLENCRAPTHRLAVIICRFCVSSCFLRWIVSRFARRLLRIPVSRWARWVMTSWRCGRCAASTLTGCGLWVDYLASWVPCRHNYRLWRCSLFTKDSLTLCPNAIYLKLVLLMIANKYIWFKEEYLNQY